MTPRWQRSFVVLVSALALVAYGGQIAHGVVVAHVECAHGELVHGAGHEGHDAPAPGDAALPGSEEAHPHCDGVTLLPAATTSLSVWPAQRAAAAATVLPHRSGEHRPVAVLALAPKSSPPAGA